MKISPYEKEVNRLDNELEIIMKKVSDGKLIYSLAKIETEKLLKEVTSTKKLLESVGLHTNVIEKYNSLINKIKQFIEDITNVEIKTSL